MAGRIMNNLGSLPAVFASGQGSTLIDVDGKRYVDFVSGIGVNCLGHNHPALVKAIARMVIRDWDGIGDADGNPVPPTPERIDALLDLPPLYDAFERDLVGPALLLADEKGLFILVNPNGSKWWRLKFRIAGKEKLLSFGTYPETGLKEARSKRDDATLGGLLGQAEGGG